jgi:hypothetical protein
LASDTATVSSPLATARDRSNPVDALVLAASDRPAQTSPATDAEIERAIVDAVTAGAFDVARVLAAALEARRKASMGNVVPLRGRGDGHH